jgi:hypothetical protein
VSRPQPDNHGLVQVGDQRYFQAWGVEREGSPRMLECAGASRRAIARARLQFADRLRRGCIDRNRGLGCRALAGRCSRLEGALHRTEQVDGTRGLR